MLWLIEAQRYEVIMPSDSVLTEGLLATNNAIVSTICKATQRFGKNAFIAYSSFKQE